jgi:hypothetical protein
VPSKKPSPQKASHDDTIIIDESAILDEDWIRLDVTPLIERLQEKAILGAEATPHYRWGWPIEAALALPQQEASLDEKPHEQRANPEMSAVSPPPLSPPSTSPLRAELPMQPRRIPETDMITLTHLRTLGSKAVEAPKAGIAHLVKKTGPENRLWLFALLGLVVLGGAIYTASHWSEARAISVPTTASDKSAIT